MNHPKTISIQDYTYDLPVEKIALHPLQERDASKLLIYRDGIIQQDIYKNIADHLPANSFLVFNNTKVIKARLKFKKISGGIIEIFCFEPYEIINEYSSVMGKTGSVTWKCMIGGVSKWKKDVLEIKLTSGNNPLSVSAKLIEKLNDAYVVEFNWSPTSLSFAEVLEHFGDIPLPPYIKRQTEKEDLERYQTIYAKDEGSVAAPTAGLHFTKEVFNRLAKNNIKTDFITLHVGAGTFKPVKAAIMQEHEMHSEWIDVSAEFIERLIKHLHKTVVTVGTTSLRTIESLYWMGVKAYLQPALTQLHISQWEVYEPAMINCNITAKDALTALQSWLKNNNQQRLFTQSQILIAPGYHFKIANAIVTNFHQPQSTLLLLVAAATENTKVPQQFNWRKIYNYAMQNDFRFLSYGDGSLLFISH
ncbi:MAG TPA: S-adenosylmethionine:tRNA ribosyltransferase-isomerase [Ferruginibacter sp.]|nr:S-adenosylmethionine:tRNA ribosyltransferase-isomerase [Ferruginibacter sp.]